MPAVIGATSVLSSAGRGADQLWASVRAGLSRIRSSQIVDRDFQPLVMGLVPEEALEPELPAELLSIALPPRARRMMRLGTPALRALSVDVGESPVPLYLGLPQLSAAEAPWIRSFALHLAKIAGLTLDVPNSRIIPSGRAAALVGVELALRALEQDPTRSIIVGGIDTFFDVELLAALETDGRLLGARVSDGFIPGEAAAFFVLADASQVAAQRATRVEVLAAASAMDPGHRSASEPARGEGLARAIEVLRERVAALRAPVATTPVATTFAGLNGESFEAKQWGVARVRHSDFFAPSMVIEHPADCIGDAGAALGSVLLVLAAKAIAAHQRAGPALVWAASDGESRACALLSAPAVDR